ncbi:MAG: DUF1501 domain-containing protein [Planctomycetes bacterium]|nr:DUF1501 domain-containing protein [Planctomycetota bacterium]MCH9724024.1 DUF1501 domain-containing protein [Planctomycetota bacterium]MCH9778080.1 DUF1501 domain-containing protein [Planctomycetota bacterium]MCH9790791.1 DUF1501 domain-containing protein [Planctomycetota bacterium]
MTTTTPDSLNLARRRFLMNSSCSVAGYALASMMQKEGLLASEENLSNPLAPKNSHFPGTAKNCIFIFLAGGPSQIDLYDPKPKLRELNGQPLPKEVTEKVRFAFINKETATLSGSSRKFTKYGECGTEFSDVLPHIGSCADDIALVRSMYTEQFNHHPAQLMMNTGVGRFGRPSVGSWLTYGLGSQSNNLPGYVVLTAGRGASGGASLWSSGSLPSTYAGVLFRNKGEAVLNLNNPPGISSEIQKSGLDAIKKLNSAQLDQTGDNEIASRIASYELAFQMQSSAPELIDLSNETKETQEAYGVNRKGNTKNGKRGGGSDAEGAFSRNCLLARRMVERGVRFVNLYHASWDHHSGLDVGISRNAGIVDQPVAALLKDLKQRGLLDSTLVVMAGEFGRTPLGENRTGSKAVTGRDHHPSAFSLWMAGGGVKGGQVIGKTHELGWSVEEDPVHINDFHATLLHLFGLNHLKLAQKFGGLDIRLTNVGGNLVEKLIA